MEYVYGIITTSSNYPSRHKIEKTPQKTLNLALSFIRKRAKGYLDQIKLCKSWNIANCGELADLALYFKTKIPVHKIKLVGNDHSFNIIGLSQNKNPDNPRSWEDEIVILDLWSGAIIPRWMWEKYALGYSRIDKIFEKTRGNPYAPIVYPLKNSYTLNDFPFCNKFVYLARKTIFNYINRFFFEDSIYLQKFLYENGLYEPKKIERIDRSKRASATLHSLRILLKRKLPFSQIRLAFDAMCERPEVTDAIRFLENVSTDDDDLITYENIEAVYSSFDIAIGIIALWRHGEVNVQTWKNLLNSYAMERKQKKKEDK